MAQRRVTSSTRKSARSESSAPPGGLSPAQLQLVAILGKEAPKWRDAVEPGLDQRADVIVWIEGRLDVGEDNWRIAKSTPELVDVLAFLYGTLGEETRAKLHAGLLAAFKYGRKPSDEPEMRRLAVLAVEQLTTREQKPKRGDVRARDVKVTRLPRSAAGTS